ncbi:MAG: polynucleotide adenylyltransferase PcnB [Gammaproteobacteria bacterium]|nr:MAG: polynucleotide adenylyltransferase PcnB [Gammaproteobacteria bacterium]
MRRWLAQLPSPISRWLPESFTQPMTETLPQPRIIPRPEHGISRKDISPEALKVLYRLNDAGFDAYLVGGGVRDLLLGGHPKDFDVATNATPEEVRELFRNSRIVGRRFRIAHVQFGRNVIEVTTFRASHDSAEEGTHHAVQADSGMLLRDNVFGSIAEDALRRDFTINALYYSIRDFSLWDFTGALEDLENRRLRIIGDPATRYREDPVRILRALRFAAKLGFTLEPATAAPISTLKSMLENIAPARLFDEILKLFMSGHGVATWQQVTHHDVLRHLMPATAHAIAQGPAWVSALIEQALANTDQRIAEDKPVTPAFLYASLLWPAVALRMAALQETLPPMDAYRRAADEVLHQQLRHITIPKRFSLPMREIWDMQWRLARRTPKSAATLLTNPRFRAGYDFLLLRESAGELPAGLGDWWTEFQQANSEEQGQLLQQAKTPGQRRPRNRRRPRTRKPRA